MASIHASIYHLIKSPSLSSAKFVSFVDSRLPLSFPSVDGVLYVTAVINESKSGSGVGPPEQLAVGRESKSKSI